MPTSPKARLIAAAACALVALVGEVDDDTIRVLITGNGVSLEFQGPVSCDGDDEEERPRPPAPADGDGWLWLSPTEAAVVKALTAAPAGYFTPGEQVAEAAGLPYSGEFKAILRNMQDRRIIEITQKGSRLLGRGAGFSAA